MPSSLSMTRTPPDVSVMNQALPYTRQGVFRFLQDQFFASSMRYCSASPCSSNMSAPAKLYRKFCGIETSVRADVDPHRRVFHLDEKKRHLNAISCLISEAKLVRSLSVTPRRSSMSHVTEATKIRPPSIVTIREKISPLI